jgi:hypothetical protein
VYAWVDKLKLWLICISQEVIHFPFPLKLFLHQLSSILKQLFYFPFPYKIFLNWLIHFNTFFFFFFTSLQSTYLLHCIPGFVWGGTGFEGIGIPHGSLWVEVWGCTGDPHGSEGGGVTVGAGWWWCFCVGGAGRGAPHGSVGAAAGCDTGAPHGSDGWDLGESKSSSPADWGVLCCK